MRTYPRRLSLAAVGVGSTLAGYAAYQAYLHGFGVDLAVGDWDPAIVGASGVVLAALGAFAHAYLGRTEAGLSRRKAAIAALRAFVALCLSGFEMLGVLAAISGFIIGISLERAGSSGLWALGVMACGVVTYASSRALLPWAKGRDEAPKETTVVFDERE